MIQRVSLPVIRALLWLILTSVILTAKSDTDPLCHDDYSASSFEKADEYLEEFIDEYFSNANIPFLPSRPNMRTLKLQPVSHDIYRLPDALHPGGGHRLYPIHPGLWKAVALGSDIWQYHLLIREPAKLAESQAFNTYNDLLGEPFADYDDQAYGMTLKPEDIRRRFGEKYFTLNVTVYGLYDDATELKRTFADVIFTDFTPWVKQNQKCSQHTFRTKEAR